MLYGHLILITPNPQQVHDTSPSEDAPRCGAIGLTDRPEGSISNLVCVCCLYCYKAICSWLQPHFIAAVFTWGPTPKILFTNDFDGFSIDVLHTAPNDDAVNLLFLWWCQRDDWDFNRVDMNKCDSGVTASSSMDTLLEEPVPTDSYNKAYTETKPLVVNLRVSCSLHCLCSQM